MKATKIIAIVLIIIGLALAVFSWIKLPMTVVTQFNFQGEVSGTMNKFFATFIPLLLTVFGALLIIRSANKNLTIRGLILSFIGILVQVSILMVNR